MNLIEQFKKYLLAEKSKPSRITIKNYLSDLRKFITWFENSKQKTFDPQSVEEIDIKNFQKYQLEKLSAVSIKRILSSLRKFFTFLLNEKIITSNPFDQQNAEKIANSDPLLLHEFKNYLYAFNSSRLTIKNYLIDVKQFINWLEQTLPEDQKNANLIDLISSEIIQEYKNRLIFQKMFSQSSINRKLSSLKKYYTWLKEQGIKNNTRGLRIQNAGKNMTSAFLSKDIESNLNTSSQFFTENEKNAYMKASYSKFPPLRLLQKLGKIALFVLDTLLITPTSELIKSGDSAFWRLKGKKIFAKNLGFDKNARIDEEAFSHIPKSMYAPLKISIANFTPLQKLIYHLKYTRPNWYHKYHQTVLSHYFNLAILFIFASSIGVSLYTAFIQTPNSKGQLFAASPTAPQRVLSFQGRLTDNNDNPITSATHVRFIIYNDPSASGSARLWEELDTATPDTNGIFSILLGSNGVGGNAALCNSGNPTTSPATTACGIPQSLFANNPSLYLGVTIESTSELTPRQQIATVPYATNAEVLQGLAPTTDSSVTGNANVVLALNSSGVLNIQGSSATTFQDTTGKFILSGNTLTLNSATGSNSNIQVAPDGLGTIDLQKPLTNSTLNNNVTTAAGAVEVDDLFAVLATSSGQSAFTINQNGAGPVISASHSGTAIFTLDASGNGVFSGNVNASTGNFTNLNVSNAVTSNLNPSLANTYSLGTSISNQWLNVYAQNIYSNGQPLTQLWQLNSGALSPLNISNDFLLGATSTGSAQFSVTGIAKNQATASLSGNLIIMPNNSWGGNIGIGTSSPLSQTGLDIEKNALGNAAAVVNQQGSGDILTASSSATTQFIVTNAGQVQARSFHDLDNTNFFLDPAATGTSLTVEGTVGIGTYTPLISTGLDIEKNASGNSALVVNQQGIGDIITASSSGATKFTVQNSGAIKDANYTTAGGILFADTNGLFTQTTAGTSGQCLQSANGGTPTWGSCGSGGSSYWTLSSPTSGALVPINNTLDVLIGANATSSAKFGFLNVNSGTPTASISAGINGALFLQANGNIQTTNSQNITIGGATSGNITLNPLNSTGTITFSGYATGIIHSANGVLSSSAVNLGGSDVTGILGVGNGGTGNNNLAAGSLFYGAGGNTALNPLAIGANNSVLVSNGSVPSWTISPTFGGNLTVNGNTTLGASSANTLTINASLNQTLLPSTNGTINLGSSSFYYGTIYADNIVNPVGNGTSGFWSLNGNTLYPVGTSYDLVIGGTSTASATFQVFAETVGTTTAGTATTSGNLVFHGSSASVNLLNGDSLAFQGSVGGDTGLSTIATLSNTGDFSINGNLTTTGGNINSAASTNNIFTTSASTINLGKSTTAVDIPGNVTLGTSSSNTLAINSLVNSNIIPFVDNTYSLGSSSNQWAGLYTHNIYLPVSGGTNGYWSMSSNVIYPTYNWQDLAIGGISTSSAKFQVFGATGNATTSGNLTFSGTGSLIQTTNNQNLTIGGNTTGNITLSPLAGIAGSALTVNAVNIGTTQTTVNLLNTTATSINFGGATTALSIGSGTGTTTINNALTTTGIFTSNNNTVLGTNSSNTITTNGYFNSSLIPSATNTYSLGSNTNEWDTLYVRQIVTPPGGGIAGYWQLSSGGVLAPSNLNNDLAIGGVSTSSAVFQVFATGAQAGTATMSGNLVLSNSANYIGTVNMQTLTLGNATTGGVAINPNNTTGLFVNNQGYVGIGTTNPTNRLFITSAASGGQLYVQATGASNNSNISIDSGAAGQAQIALYDSGTFKFSLGKNNDNTFFMWDGAHSRNFETLDTNGNLYLEPAGGSVGIGTISPLTSTGLDIEKNALGNAAFLVNQLGSGNIITASSSGNTEFTLSNTGVVTASSFYDLQNSAYFLDPAATGTSLTTAGSVGIGTTTPGELLQVGSGNSQISFGTSDAANGAWIRNDGTNTVFATKVGSLYIGYSGASNPINFMAGGSTTQMLLNTAGNLGIGTIGPNNKLTVSGDYNGSSDGWAADSGAGQLVVKGVTNANLAFGIGVDTTNSVIRLQGQNIGTGSLPIALNPQGGSVGIGTTTPTANQAGDRLAIYGNDSSDVYATIEQGSTGQAALGIRRFGGTAQYWINYIPSGTTTLKWYDTAGGNINVMSLTQGGLLTIKSTLTQNGTPDIAEGILVKDTTINAGDIVVPDNTQKETVVKSQKEYDPRIVGIISTDPGIYMHRGLDKNLDPNNPNIRPLVLGGRIPTKVTSSNGTILSGDTITSSSIHGFGMKATKSGITVGRAMENFTPSDTTCPKAASVSAIVWPTDNGYNPAKPCFKLPDGTYVGKIMVFENVAWYDPNAYLTTTGNIAIKQDATPSANFTVPHYYTLLDTLGQPISQMGTFLEVAVGNLRAGSIQAQQTLTNTLAITTNNVSVAGQSLNDYIISVVNNAINNGLLSKLNTNTNIISPIAQVNHLATNIISPLASSSAIALRFDQNKISIFNDNNATGSAVTSFDNNGNATLSGTLTSKNLAVNGDATISGTLHANKIEANSIVGLKGLVGTLSAQNITNVTNIFFATPSAMPATSSSSQLANLSSTQSSQLTNNFIDVASYSAYLAYVPSLKSITGEFDQGLVSLGATSLSDTTINGQLSLGSNFIFSQDSINVIGADLALQPLRQGGINFEGGLLTIDTDGNLTVNGNTAVKGILAANVISPLPNQDLSLKLPNIATTSATAFISSQFLIKNSSGSAVVAFNNLGDITASGAATVNKLNFNLVAPALAVSPTESVATGSAGTTQINVNQKSLTIDDPLVTANSIIYITPVGDSKNQTPFLLRQNPSVSFTVGLSFFAIQAVKFNWLIVN